MGFESKLAHGANVTLIGIALTLTGCSSPEFTNPPPADYLAPPPAAINGTWANEEDNGQRVRLLGQKDGTLKLYFSQIKPSADASPKDPLQAQTMHFDNTDWILLDFRKLAAWQGEEPYTEKSPYRLLKYVLETPDRLCGIELDTGVVAAAIKTGQLEGKVVASSPLPPQGMGMMASSLGRVVVTSPGDVWVKWWISLPESGKKFGPKWCFVRAT